MKYILLLSILISSCSGRQPIVKTGFEGHPMPSFNLLLMDSTTRINTSNIPNDEPVVIFYFSPLCPYCRAQTKDIVDDITPLTNIRIIMLSNFPYKLIKAYYDYYHLKKYSNITVAQDYDSYFTNYYQAKGVPYLAIYDHNKNLKQVLMGKVGINLIKDIAHQ